MVRSADLTTHVVCDTLSSIHLCVRMWNQHMIDLAHSSSITPIQRLGTILILMPEEARPHTILQATHLWCTLQVHSSQL